MSHFDNFITQHQILKVCKNCHFSLKCPFCGLKKSHSLFVCIVQRAVKSWIIANLQESLYVKNFFFFYKERHSKLNRKKGILGKNGNFANFKYAVRGYKMVKMAQHFTCSCFSCISKDIDVRQNFFK